MCLLFHDDLSPKTISEINCLLSGLKNILSQYHIRVSYILSDVHYPGSPHNLLANVVSTLTVLIPYNVKVYLVHDAVGEMTRFVRYFRWFVTFPFY